MLRRPVRQARQGYHVDSRGRRLRLASGPLHPRRQLDVRLAEHHGLPAVRLEDGCGDGRGGLRHRLSPDPVRELLDDPGGGRRRPEVAGREWPLREVPREAGAAAIRRRRLVGWRVGHVRGPPPQRGASRPQGPEAFRRLHVQPVDEPDVQHPGILHQRLREDHVPGHVQGPYGTAALHGRHHLPVGYDDECGRVLGQCCAVHRQEPVPADGPDRLVLLRRAQSLQRTRHAALAHLRRRLRVDPGRQRARRAGGRARGRGGHRRDLLRHVARLPHVLGGMRQRRGAVVRRRRAQVHGCVCQVGRGEAQGGGQALHGRQPADHLYVRPHGRHLRPRCRAHALHQRLRLPPRPREEGRGGALVHRAPGHDREHDPDLRGGLPHRGPDGLWRPRGLQARQADLGLPAAVHRGARGLREPRRAPRAPEGGREGGAAEELHRGLYPGGPGRERAGQLARRDGQEPAQRGGRVHRGW
mmetsp:Transcript_29118/g.64070  ORF Transcript_29118/g.64070 Transcript_29118/m.64070 type:complete len:471 (+) Transcript_29118:499-1911(+)